MIPLYKTLEKANTTYNNRKQISCGLWPGVGGWSGSGARKLSGEVETFCILIMVMVIEITDLSKLSGIYI